MRIYFSYSIGIFPFPISRQPVLGGPLEPTRARAFSSIATHSLSFRSIQRREEEILSSLTGPLLHNYERNVAAAGAKSNSLAELFDAAGATDQLAREGITLQQLLDKITQVTIAPTQ